MTEKIVMPKLGMTMTEGTIEEWHKEVGDPVETGEAVLTISSDKLTQEVESPSSGVLLQQSVETGDEAKVGEVIAIVGEEGAGISEVDTDTVATEDEEEMSESKEETKTATSISRNMPGKSEEKRIFISPLARKMAEDKDFDIERIKGTGGNGRITKIDITRIEQSGYDYESTAESTTTTSEQVTFDTASIGAGLTGMRKQIARNMRESLATSAQLTLHRKADANKLIKYQQKLREEMEAAKMDVRLTLTVMIARATVLALQEFKKMNATYYNGELTEHEDVHLGIATSLDEGLLVPVVKNAHHKTIGSLAKEIREVSTIARDGEAGGDILSGSTFTITNMGATGIEYFTPILNTPEVGILGVGATQEALKLTDDGKVEKEMQIPFSITFDHQILDGADAAEFLEILIKYIETPTLLLL